tara:strand:- start:467 stop:733 length:267 start_codon:yes stop_codon:yes gene_type:complete
MKITKRQLRRIIREEALKGRIHARRRHAGRGRETFEEGIFGGALKGLIRAIPGVGDIAADAHTSSVIDALDEKLTDIVTRLEALEAAK